MKHVIFRITSVVVALTISTLIVFALSHAGKSTKGPIEDAITYTGEAVKQIEQKLIIEDREEKREDKLAWLKQYSSNRKLLTHPDRMLLGAFDNQAHEDFESVVALEDTLKNTFPLIHLFTAWGSKPEERFPTDYVKNIIALGSIPVITWEPWLSDFTEEEYPSGGRADRDKNGMKDITAGMYDKYIINWALNAKAIKTPLFVRLGHEMNDGYRYPWGPQNNAAADFAEAWRHIHTVFANQGVKNVIWIWSPHPAYEAEPFYPGDAYVDYIGAGVLNYGTIAVWSKWWSFKDIFGKYYKQMAIHKKPMMITEFGSLAVGGDRAEWYAEALDSMQARYPLVKSVMFYHVSKDNTTTQQTLNWYIKNDKEVVDAVVKGVNRWK